MIEIGVEAEAEVAVGNSYYYQVPGAALSIHTLFPAVCSQSHATSTSPGPARRGRLSLVLPLGTAVHRWGRLYRTVSRLPVRKVHALVDRVRVGLSASGQIRGTSSLECMVVRMHWPSVEGRENNPRTGI